MDVDARAQRILSAIGYFQRDRRKAARMVGGFAGKNRCSCNRKGHVLRMKNQEVVK